ncbi:MAG: toll/interleukin-1 receptor domain-containing protein [Bacteroidales bacterium]|nr:toll/interleukin-1 receptor domain-containing protein [Bacteroidales bacterium]
MDVFLSYSWKDRQIAKRLYDDLKNSGVKIWRDQIDGDPVADFKNEFLHKIDECQYFILLDSPNYRSIHKSKSEHWCLEEVKRCLDNQKNKEYPKIIVCLLEKDGKWRKQFPYDDFKSAFEKVNALKFIQLYYSEYDNSGIYDLALNKISALLGTSYQDWHSIPTMRDLEDELNAENNKNHELGNTLLDDATENIIVKGYEIIHSKIEKHYPNINESFEVWLKDCHHSGTKLFFPEWTYAVWLINQPGYDKEKAYHYFDILTTEYPDDPRGFRGKGGVLKDKADDFYNKNDYAMSTYYYEKSLESLLEAERLLLLPEKQHQRKICMFGVLYNIGTLLHIIRYYHQAWDYWEKALALMQEEGRFYDDLVENIFILRISNLHHDADAILQWLQELQKMYILEPVIYKCMGMCYKILNKVNDAVLSFEKAYSLQPDMDNLNYLTQARKSINN